MFNTEWWHSKNQSKELTLGWIYNNHIKNDFAKGYTKNLTDYWSVEMATFLRQQFADDHIGSLFEKAHKAGFSKMLVFKQGTIPLWNFQDEFVKYFDDKPAFPGSWASKTLKVESRVSKSTWGLT